MRKKFFSLRYKVLGFTFAIVLFAVLLVGFVSYQNSSLVIQEKVSNSNLNTVTQIGHNMEFILDDINNVSLNLIQNQEIRDFLKLNYHEPEDVIRRQKVLVEQSITSQFGSLSFVDSIYIKSFNGISLDTSGRKDSISPELEDKIIAENGGKVWGVDKVVDYNGSVKHVISLMRLYNNIHHLEDDLAILKVDISEESFAKFYMENELEENSRFMMLGQNHEIISSDKSEEIGEKISQDLIEKIDSDQSNGFYEMKIDGEPHLITYYHLNGFPFTLVNVVLLHELIKENKVVKKITLAVIVFSFLLCAILTVFFTSRVLGPLKQLQGLMADVEKGEFNHTFQSKSNDEITLLGKSFNHMSLRLKELIDKVYIAKMNHQEAEFKALQAQINPHFLYNTLDTIYWMARIEKAYESSKLVQALSNLFRLSLNRGQELTTVQEEIRHLENYIMIQKVRYEEIITFNLNVDEDVLSCKTIKLILQPLVENAIYHGIKATGDTGKIDINVKKEKNKLVFEVIDDGVGIDLENINKVLNEEISNKGGYGIKNVHQRIQLSYGDQYGISFEHYDEKGTKVTVRQPIMK
ncbi:cache domain-containing sensor histidine kinase [Aquibacillus albus]|uniref:histidine kinase n=1 Tax=Aquibacillus albus TaxID=1168171 RepID=A0ABS2N4H3_9BACI|nr:sensor histidine kinase [Aquibacillus albus]MBM7573003.1 two-component system sensor histidine kinase YesM [Aquibacillus albus]